MVERDESSHINCESMIALEAAFIEQCRQTVDEAVDSIRPFFELLGEHCQQIEAVAMDMNTAFDLEVKKHFSFVEKLDSTT